MGELEWFSEDYVAQTLFMSSIFMYISMAVVYSRGSPYRKPVWTNWLFILALAILIGLSLGIVLGKADWIDALFEFKYEYRTVDMTEDDSPLYLPPLPKIDSNYPEVRLLFIVLGAVHFLLAYIAEEFLVNNPKIWKWCKR